MVRIYIKNNYRVLKGKRVKDVRIDVLFSIAFNILNFFNYYAIVDSIVIHSKVPKKDMVIDNMKPVSDEEAGFRVTNIICSIDILYDITNNPIRKDITLNELIP